MKLKNVKVAVRAGSKRPLRTELTRGLTLPKRPCTQLIWTAAITLNNLDAANENGKRLPSRERIAVHKQIACEQFRTLVSSVLVASHIAKPGVVLTEPIDCWTRSGFFGAEDPLLGFFGEVVEFAGDNSWPKIQNLPIKQVWRWMRQFDPFTENLGKTAVDRALNAFSYLLSAQRHNGRELIDLMWAMIGLEALFGRGTADLTFQLVGKTGALLGEHQGFEKRVKEMYRFRSLFVHGKAPFPNSLYKADALEEYERFNDDATDASFLASAVLIASLQQLAKRSWKNASFSFVVDDPPRGP